MFSGKKERICATIEARMTSSRLPGKVIMDLCGKPVLLHIVERLKKSKYLDDIIVATTVNKTDDPIVSMCEKNNISYFRGSEEDVLLRVLDAAKTHQVDIIVEITGDCPVIDWRHADTLIEKFFSSECDYCANTIKRTFPRGFDTQVFRTSTLNKVNLFTSDLQDHEHVSLFIYNHPEIFKLKNWEAPEEMYHPELEITLDTKEDYHLIKNIYDALYTLNNDFSGQDVVDYLLSNPALTNLIKDVTRKSVV